MCLDQFYKRFHPDDPYLRHFVVSPVYWRRGKRGVRFKIAMVLVKRSCPRHAYIRTFATKLSMWTRIAKQVETISLQTSRREIWWRAIELLHWSTKNDWNFGQSLQLQSSKCNRVFYSYPASPIVPLPVEEWHSREERAWPCWAQSRVYAPSWNLPVPGKSALHR